MASTCDPCYTRYLVCSRPVETLGSIGANTGCIQCLPLAEPCALGAIFGCGRDIWVPLRPHEHIFAIFYLVFMCTESKVQSAFNIER